MSDEPYLDATGVRLEAGVKVAWGVGGKYNFGLAIGEVVRTETVTTVRKQYDRAGGGYVDFQDVRREVEVRSLQKGRMGRTFTPEYRGDGRFPVIAIADQDFTGNR